MKRERGFTLMEVLVALAVLAIAMGALIRSVSASASSASYLRDRTLAHWVAMNKVAELQVLQQSRSGAEEGTEDMANHEWHWKVTATESGITGVQRLEVSVRRNRDDEQPLATLVALLGKP